MIQVIVATRSPFLWGVLNDFLERSGGRFGRSKKVVIAL